MSSSHRHSHTQHHGYYTTTGRTSTCGPSGNNSTHRQLASFKQGAQQQYDPLSPFRTLLDSITLTPQEECLIRTCLASRQQESQDALHKVNDKRVPTSTSDSFNTERVCRVPEAATDTGYHEEPEVKAPPGILEEIADLEEAWRIWNQIE
ncbi:hypothetical protein CONLIGDRAFT_153866 [Coniochaeta ligniaria NRRL 30616]|uniref:Uncharacterized protein n=1 Tax=Coniochaeta ligniaria NRRL 30616 TaxID=1408157 RepID=A0A1J7JYD4_9PEZI|nr:hypothetical protein CONLIGDRAFT_153866 [Coniochaeta ligniaria NRRL 30616]